MPHKPTRAGGRAFEVRSYRQFRRLVRGLTSAELRDRYDRHTYEQHVGGPELARTYFESAGLAPTIHTRRELELAELGPRLRVLDVGCGRGEIVFQAAALGADAVGVDYSPAAIEVAEETRARHDPELRARTRLLVAEADALPFADESFDRVFLLDVVEHLAPAELMASLHEIRRVLAPDGLLIVHTSPNVWRYTLGWRLRQLAGWLRIRPRIEHPKVATFRALRAHPELDEAKMLLHVNEQSVLSLKLTLLRAGFRSRVWIDATGNIWAGRPGRLNRAKAAVYDALGLRFLFGARIYALARPRRRRRSATA